MPKFFTASSGMVEGMSGVQIEPGATAFTRMPRGAKDCAKAQHGAAPSVSEYSVVMLRDTLENWQSEFLQLIWQIGGLAILLYVGSPQSKENDDRMEAKIDAMLAVVDHRTGEGLVDEIDRAYAGRHTDPRWLRLAQRDDQGSGRVPPSPVPDHP